MAPTPASTRDPLTGEPYEAECREAIEAIRSHSMVAYVGLINLFQQALFCEQNQIPGAFVECGTWKGGSCGLMAAVNLRHGTERRDLHLFDAFTEICEPDAEKDGSDVVDLVRGKVPGAGADGRLVPLTGVYDDKGGPGRESDCRGLLEEKVGYPAEKIKVHTGWFQQTVPSAAERPFPIAILRLDGDWYASTKVCLDHLFDLVVPGGFVVIDDYGAYEGCRRAVDEFLATQNPPLFLHYVNPDIRYLVKV